MLRARLLKECPGEELGHFFFRCRDVVIDSALTKTIGLAVLTAVLATFVALANGGAAPSEAAGVVAMGDSAHVDSTQRDSSVTVHWLSDANILSLLGAIDARQTALADAELQAWHSDTVRAFATAVAHNAADMQHTADSLATQVRLAPVAPAIQDPIVAQIQPHIDTVTMNHGPQMDRVFLQQTVAVQQLVNDDLTQMSGVATRPEIQALLASAQDRAASQLARAKQIQGMFVVADSITADSLARRAAARNKRQAGNQ